MKRLVELRSSDYYFFVSVKASFPNVLYNKIINFRPILRPYFVEEEFHNFLQKKKFKPTRMLTQLLSTMGEYMSFSQYYLWFLIDLGMKIESYKEMDVFHTMKTYNFNEFITHFMAKRIQAKRDKKKGLEMCCKIILNASYGKDGMIFNVLGRS
jgi:hypothetical protein